jgi:hypothetical protein
MSIYEYQVFAILDSLARIEAKLGTKPAPEVVTMGPQFTEPFQPQPITRESARELARELSEGAGARLETVYAGIVEAYAGIVEAWRMLRVREYGELPATVQAVEARLRDILEAAGKLPEGD